MDSEGGNGAHAARKQSIATTTGAESVRVTCMDSSHEGAATDRGPAATPCYIPVTLPTA
jgi:hypothetical protein